MVVTQHPVQFYAWASLNRAGVPAPTVVTSVAIPGIDADLVTPRSWLLRGGDDGAEAEAEAWRWRRACWELPCGVELLPGSMPIGRWWVGVPGLGIPPPPRIGRSSIFRYGGNLGGVASSE
jgi:hypothetical protein